MEVIDHYEKLAVYGRGSVWYRSTRVDWFPPIHPVLEVTPNKTNISFVIGIHQCDDSDNECGVPWFSGALHWILNSPSWLWWWCHISASWLGVVGEPCADCDAGWWLATPIHYYYFNDDGPVPISPPNTQPAHHLSYPIPLHAAVGSTPP